MYICGTCMHVTTNINHRICNQQISLNSKGTTPGPCIDKNRSRYVFYTCELATSYDTYKSPHWSLSPIDDTLGLDSVRLGVS